MADIKLYQQNENAAAAERSFIKPEKIKKSLESFSNGEKEKNSEPAEKNAISAEKNKMAAPAVSQTAAIIAPDAKRQKQVESILAQDLGDIYLNLEPAKRREFKKAGEETAKKISQLLTKAKINIGEIIKLIKKWLALIPGINKYFLEQEAKIKADELIKIKSYNDQ